MKGSVRFMADVGTINAAPGISGHVKMLWRSEPTAFRRVAADVSRILWGGQFPAGAAWHGMPGPVLTDWHHSVWMAVPRLLIIANNSRRVAALSRNAPSMRLVTMVTPGL